ncbi:MAG: hypothetical protein ACT4OF_02575 [Caulobacteraceae bacterium]
MQVQKLRGSANGLVPAGAYFAAIAAKLEEMNASEAALQDELDEEDRRIEARYRRASASPAERLANDHHAIM